MRAWWRALADLRRHNPHPGPRRWPSRMQEQLVAFSRGNASDYVAANFETERSQPPS
jgi:hypothetical protein